MVFDLINNPYFWFINIITFFPTPKEVPLFLSAINSLFRLYLSGPGASTVLP